MTLPASWKTTLAGIALIVAGLALAILKPEDKLEVGIGFVLTGAALIAARDDKVTSEASGAAATEWLNLLTTRSLDDLDTTPDTTHTMEGF
jgi:drug/metabolite transporter (DMT)-like permease